ncbi:MAG TPA: hypothetical protein PLQ45_03230 [Anaerohalosphaeraceae bacterium]|nr:hypothetical protein [Anaerohalosphaeraceae bacterium]
MKTSTVWLGVFLLCVFGLGAQALELTTEIGQGADAYLSNDEQQSPNTNTGAEVRMRAWRVLANTRFKSAYIRFDLNNVLLGDPEQAVLKLAYTYIKGGASTITVYGVKDGPGDYWAENTITYNTALPFVPNPPTTLGNYELAEGQSVQLGTLASPEAQDLPLSVTTAPEDLPLKDFLNADTNGLVTFFFIGPNDEDELATKENQTYHAPTLILPDAIVVSRASDPVPAINTKVMAGQYTTLSWVNPEPNMAGGVVTCDVYFGDKEPNSLLPNYGLSLLEADVAGNLVAMPALDAYKTYYWCVDTYDTSRSPEYVQGKVWNFNTHNSAPVVDAGADQYVWVTKTVVDAASDADTSLRDSNPDGGNIFMDVRGGAVDRVGYLRFDLSELSALGPGTLQNASLTLYKVAGSRNDAITNGRFSLHGLNNVPGNTPQNWSEAALTRNGAVIPGQEWNNTVPMTNAIANGWITDLDDGVAGISEVIANDVITVSGSALEAFLQSRINDGGLTTFIIANEDSNDRGYGIATKENPTPGLHPRLQLTYI